ncbi:hypothetical protein ACJZ2D_015436 [Fusarium nematophilum]
MQRFAFVSCHDGPIDRLKIRSHCMKGRNRREGSRRSVRSARQRQDASQPGALFQPQPPLDSSITQFASRVNKSAHEVLHQGNELSIHPVEVCVDFDLYKTDRSAWPLDDHAFLSTVLLSTSALRDYALQQSPTTATRFHLVMTLSLLNDKLSFSNAHLLDSNIYLTLCLAVMAGIFGDGPATAAHLSGLHKMVALRGGSEYFKRQPKLQHKLESLDLLWCLSFGGEPQFLRGPVCWEPCFHSDVDIPLELFDSRLSAVFCDVRHLVALVNAHHEQKTRLSAELFQPALSSCQTRLLLLKDSLDPLSQWLCLGILAFLTTMFRLPGRKLQYPHLASQLHRSCETTDARPQALLFWFLIVSAVAVEPWLHGTWKRIVNPDLSWDDARVRLQRVMWIGCIQDELGRQAFSAMQAAHQA